MIVSLANQWRRLFASQEMPSRIFAAAGTMRSACTALLGAIVCLVLPNSASSMTSGEA